MQTEWVVQNPQASAPLVIALNVECNTPTEKILDNIRRNSDGRTGWQKLEDAHSGIAVLCGSGPSLRETLGEISALQATGADVFALNGAAKFLNDKGIFPEFQVILDAQPKTLELVGPAGKHLFASQVDPSLFERVPDAKLWHATHGAIAPEFPEYQDDYCMIGGAISVGNAALVLAYVMGYRTIHCFGFDSSHRAGASHAFDQPMNAGEPTTIVKIGERQYLASLTMRLQSQYFVSRAAELKRLGCTVEVHGDGLLPDTYNAELSEQDKYRLMWSFEEYRYEAPGEALADEFLEVAKPDGLVIDFGCGTGRGALAIHNKGVPVILLDFADNCRDEAAADLPFAVHDITKPSPVHGKAAFCTDVLEHIPPEDVDRVVGNIMRAAPKAFFSVGTTADGMGVLIGKQLHLTVEGHEAWRARFSRFGRIAYEREAPGQSIFYVER